MESSYSIEPHENLVRMQVWGEMTVDGLMGLLARVGNDSGYRAGMNGLADFREAHGQWDYTEIQRFRDYLVHATSRGTACRWAAIAKPGDLAAAGHVVIVISEAVDSNIRMRLFDDPVTALRWLSGAAE